MKRMLFMVLLAVICSSGLFSQEKTKDAPNVTGFRAEFLSQMAGVEKKILDLAEAVPQEKYSWRPMEGVRSISEVYMHIAGANYLFPSFVGIKTPAGIERDAETKVTEKAKVIAYVKASFDHIRKVITDTPDADLEKPAKMFGKETTVRDIFFNAGLHMHEHLGQSIAYVRMNNIVPPWTAEEQKVEQAKSTKK
jgi:uncharacterized damage-inducible protein DinB